MDYKYPPIYKYIILLILITTFLRYYKVITKENFLVIAGIFTYMVFIFDFILIKNHPALLTETQNENFGNVIQDNKKVIYVKKSKSKSKKNKLKVIKEDEDLVDTDLDEKFEKELEELNKKAEDTDTENLTDEIQRELDELDL
jgi:hypothetical protein